MRPDACPFMVAAAAALALFSACARAPQGPKPPLAKGGLTALASVLKGGLGERSGERSGEQGRERRLQDPTLYVDGVPAAALTYVELPRSLSMRWKTLASGRVVHRFRVAELLEALGLDLASVKQAHFYGGRDRISIVDGAEIRRVRDEFLFSFTQSDRGRPRIHYPDQDMTVSARIDLIDNVAVYVHKEPPRSEGKYQTLTFGDGRPIEGIPYAVGERPGGTRVYADGALRAFVKRRSLPSPIADASADDDAPPRFSLQSYAESLGIPWVSVKAMELLGGDDMLACLDAAALAAAPPLTFTLARHSRGLLAVDVPEASEPVQAIAFYIKQLPPDRAAQDRSPVESAQKDIRENAGRPGRRCASVK